TRDLCVAVGGGVLVAHGSAGGGVAEPAHELGKGCAGLGREDGAGMAQVVPAQVWPAGGLPRWVVDLVERRRRHVPVAVGRGGEEQRVLAGRGVLGQVRLDRGEQMWRDRDVAHARIALGWADDELAADPHDGTTYLDPPGPQVDVTAA